MYAWYDKGDGRQVYRRVPELDRDVMSDLPCPQIMGDSMPPTQSMLDGRLYDSKSALRRTYKAAGVVEVGNDPARFKPRAKPKIERREVKETLERATARFERGERA